MRTTNVLAVFVGVSVAIGGVAFGLPDAGATLWSSIAMFGMGALLIYAPVGIIWAARTCSQTPWVHAVTALLSVMGGLGSFSQTTDQVTKLGLTMAQLSPEQWITILVASMGNAMLWPMLIYGVAGLRRLAGLPSGSLRLVPRFAGSFAVLVGLKMLGTASALSSFAGFFFGIMGALSAAGFAYLFYGLIRGLSGIGGTLRPTLAAEVQETTHDVAGSEPAASALQPHETSMEPISRFEQEALRFTPGLVKRTFEKRPMGQALQYSICHTAAFAGAKLAELMRTTPQLELYSKRTRPEVVAFEGAAFVIEMAIWAIPPEVREIGSRFDLPNHIRMARGLMAGMAQQLSGWNITEDFTREYPEDYGAAARLLSTNLLGSSGAKQPLTVPNQLPLDDLGATLFVPVLAATFAQTASLEAIAQIKDLTERWASNLQGLQSLGGS